ncbi:MAG: hypothetical protein HN996_03620, partial [Opitutae bacterium]|nr:hypothetical protein [Opitutae bacterium]
MSHTVIELMGLNGPLDVADQVLDLIQSVEDCAGSDEDRLAVIRDVYARLKETR